jgi:hypothetical protein
MELNRSKHVNVPLLLMAASAVVAIGAVAGAVGQERAVGQEQTWIIHGGSMSTGQTTTTTVPTTIPIARATPAVKAPHRK